MEEMKDLNPLEDVIDPNEQKLLFTELAKIEGFHEYLRALMSRDLKLHFSTKKEHQDLVKGAYHRVEYLAKMVKSHSIDNK